MCFGVSAFSVPKQGGISSENQDAFLPRVFSTWKGIISARRQDYSEKQLVIGVADGATEGILAGIWANALLKAASPKNSSGMPAIEAIIAHATKLWKKFKTLKSKGGKRSLTNLPDWLEEQTLDRGAFSTLCLAHFSDDFTWQALAVGDSCMFKVSGDELNSSWPINSSEAFGNSPYLIASETEFNQSLMDQVKVLSGVWHPTDRFYFATDALAAWFLQQNQHGGKPWVSLNHLDAEAAPEGFREFINSERDSGRLRNDDTTLLRLEFLPM